MATIFHLALASDWAAAQRAGCYAISTRGRTLAEEGFIHASRADQWPAVRERFYADVTEPLVLLKIDTDLLGVPLVEEPAVPGGAETFPHIYGPLPTAAVTRVIPLDPNSATTQPHSATMQPQGSFTQVYFREMFFNAALVLLVVGLGFAGLVCGSNIDNENTGRQGVFGSVGGVLGIALGIVAAVYLYRRRRRS